MTSTAPETTGVPFLDLRPSHEPLAESILADIAALIETNAYINGPAVAEFEREFAEFCGSPYASVSRAGSTPCGSRSSQPGWSEATR